MTKQGSKVESWRGLEVLFVSPTPTHPQDHGNRKRFFELCTELKLQGASIHYVHYASEHDWRHVRPAQHEKEMIAAWDSYQLVAPSRPLHEGSKGEDHMIDEWADPALTSYVRWACSVRRYDICIVAYTWMSFCFEGVPEGVFKICDTNDLFSGRRDVLEGNGVAPEFFHTTPDEEAKGLARADLVWAIKESEQRYFENQLKLKNCQTLLYSEPDRNWWKGKPSQDGWLRAGVIGARNNINRRNLENFLAVALPVFESYMAPLKIVIAGGCSEDFREYKHPNVEVLGRVPDVADFYRDMDIIIAPMQFSTGLKIKVAEALASGAPLMAHAHAIEGYPEFDPLHAMSDFSSMAMELVKLSFDPSSLPALAGRSRASNQRIKALVLETLENTRLNFAASGENTVCIVAPMEALDPRGLLFDHLYSALNYMRFAVKLALYVVGKPAKVDANILKQRGFDVRIFVEPALAQALGEKQPDSWTALNFADALDSRGIKRAYFLAEASNLEMLGASALHRAYVRSDAVELSGGDSRGLVDLLKPITQVVVLAADTSAVKGIDDMVHGVCQVPFRRKNVFSSFTYRAGVGHKWDGVLLLVQATDPYAGAVKDLVSNMGFACVILNVDNPADLRAVVGPTEKPGNAANVTGARLLIDLTDKSSAAAVIAEGARRSGVPVLRLARGGTALHTRGIVTSARAKTVFSLLRLVASGLIDGSTRQQLIETSHIEAKTLAANDVGWSWLWRDLKPSVSNSVEKSAAHNLFS